MNDSLEKFEKEYAKDLILHNLGDNAIHYANDFTVGERFYTKYKSLIQDNKKFIQGQNVVDVGSHMGHWSLLSLLDGAESCTCLEPRQEFVDGINNFAQHHQLNMRAIQGIHSDLFVHNKKYDTVLLCSMITSIPDIFFFFLHLKKITKYVIIRHASLVDVPAEMLKVVPNMNLNQRATVDYRIKNHVPTHNDIADRNTADATLWWFYGTKFLQNIFEHLNYKILRFEEQKHDPSHTDPNCQYHNIVLEVN